MTIERSNISDSLYFLFFSRHIILDSFSSLRDKIKCATSRFDDQPSYPLIHPFHKSFDSIVLRPLYRLLHDASDPRLDPLEYGFKPVPDSLHDITWSILDCILLPLIDKLAITIDQQ